MKASAIFGKDRAKTTQAMSPASPTNPTAEETSLFGRVGGAGAIAVMTVAR